MAGIAGPEDGVDFVFFKRRTNVPRRFVPQSSKVSIIFLFRRGAVATEL